MEALAGQDRSQTAPQMLTAPGERHIVGDGEVEAHSPEQCVQEPFGLAQREMVEEPQGQGGLDGEIRVPPLPTPLAAPAGRPGSDRFPRTPTPSHRRGERGPDCRPANSQCGTSSYTWDEPSTASLQCGSCGDEKGGPNRPTRRRSFMQQRHQPSASTARHVRGVIGPYSRRRTASTSTSEGSPNPRPYPNKSATVVEPNRLSSSSR